MALAQYEEDAERLKAAGAHDVKVLGNLKFDFTPNAIQLRTGREILKFAERDIICLASSREGEEQKFLEAAEESAGGRRSGRSLGSDRSPPPPAV